jgi:ubiquinone/menaquinone biosynthesis C-methylase UbiE
VIRHLDLGSVQSVLDIGCGLGEFLELLDPGHKIEKVGTDFIQANLAVCTRKVEGQFIYLDIDKADLPFKADRFDLVVSFGVLEHVQNPTHLLREAHRVARGKAVFMTPNIARPSRVMAAMAGKEKPSFAGHKQSWDYQLFKQVLEKNEWIVEQVITRFVDCPFHACLPKRMERFLSYQILPKIFPKIGSELFAFCRKHPKEGVRTT